MIHLAFMHAVCVYQSWGDKLVAFVGDRTWAITLICLNISTDSWTSHPAMSQSYKPKKNHNLQYYNASDNNDTIKLLSNFYCRNQTQLEYADVGTANTIWLGKFNIFNRHHLSQSGHHVFQSSWFWSFQTGVFPK